MKSKFVAKKRHEDGRMIVEIGPIKNLQANDVSAEIEVCLCAVCRLHVPLTLFSVARLQGCELIVEGPGHEDFRVQLPKEVCSCPSCLPQHHHHQ